MTIHYEQRHADVYAGKTFCRTCDRHLAAVHHGYGSEMMPLDAEDQELLDEAATSHDDAFHELHEVVVFSFSPNHAKP